MPIAIVTGASRGFGKALATALVSEGWSVIVDARDADALTAAAADIAGAARAGGAVHAVPGDITFLAHQADLVAAANGLGGLDLLVNNAGTLGPTPLPRLAELTPWALEETFAVNVVAPLALVQAALPALRASRGTVVNISSDAAVEGYEGWGGYGASKAALDQLGNVLAAEEPAITVHRFDPGDMRTQMHQDAFPGEDISDRPLPETVVPALLRLLASGAPSGRYKASEFARPLEVA